MKQILHLGLRFFGSLRPGPPQPGDEAWARSMLGPDEEVLWQRMSNPDRRHAVSVARGVVVGWPEVAVEAGAQGVGPHDAETSGEGAEPPRPVVAAALLHDVGKVDSGLRTPERVVATLIWAALDDEVAARWAERQRGMRSRYGRYRRHPEIGGVLLRAAAADPLTARWAEEHHRPPEQWTVPSPVAELLKACDDD